MRVDRTICMIRSKISTKNGLHALGEAAVEDFGSMMPWWKHWFPWRAAWMTLLLMT